MAFHDVRLPVDVERGAQGGPGFRTSIIALKSGKERRNADWSKARGKWDIGYGIQSRADMEEVISFFYQRLGSAHGFRFKDWLDFSGTQETLGIGNGVTTAFQVIKTYGTTYAYIREINLLVSGTLSVYKDGVLVDPVNYSVSASGLITFLVAPGNTVEVTATFEFDIRARFDTDDLTIALEYYNAGAIPSIPVIELREDD